MIWFTCLDILQNLFIFPVLKSDIKHFVGQPSFVVPLTSINTQLTSRVSDKTILEIFVKVGESSSEKWVGGKYVIIVAEGGGGS